VIDKSIHREGQVFWFAMSKSIVMPQGVFLIVGRMHHEESNQEVWRVVELETGEESCFSEDFLRIKEASSRCA
jgi:hypothetical protein